MQQPQRAVAPEPSQDDVRAVAAVVLDAVVALDDDELSIVCGGLTSGGPNNSW